MAIDLAKLGTFDGTRDALEHLAAREGAQLGPPATKEQLDEAEGHLGVRLPDGFRRLYSVANGWDREGVDFELLTLAGVVDMLGAEPSFLPFLHIVECDYLAMSLDGAILEVSSWANQTEIAPSLELWLAGELLRVAPYLDDLADET